MHRFPTTVTLMFVVALILGFANTAAAQDARPNILLILADDLGYSDLGSYGGEIETPHIDQLAQNGLRFTQMYNSARCCPSRASLLTGLYPHQTGIGNFVGHRPKAPHGYRGSLQPNTVTLAEVLKAAGYRTSMVGKWHVNDPPPTKQGFEQFYGFIHGYASDSWNPKQMIRLPKDEDPEHQYKEGEYFAANAVTDYALTFIEQARQQTPDKPWFSYVAYRGPHFPVQAPEKYIEKYKDTYKAGWDQLRRERLARMKSLGVVSKDTQLSPRSSIPIPKMAKKHGVPGDLQQNPPWRSINEKRRRDLARRMAVYAGMVDNMDDNIGRLINDLKANNELNNTLIVFLSDNGGCAEWGPFGFDLRKGMLNSPRRGVGVNGRTPGSSSETHTGEALQQMGGPKGDGFAYGSGWANLSNTPLSEYKMYTHEGGISTPMIVHWPGRIEDAGKFRRQPAHFFDIMATFVQVAGARYPDQQEGHAITPMEGQSLVPVFDGQTLGERTFVFAHSGNAALRRGPWKLVAKHALADRGLRDGADWQLYNIERDRPEIHDLASKKPEKVKQLKQRYIEAAWRVGIFPKAK